MHLVRISLRQFRNFSRLDLSPGPGVNVLIGPNGAGKSNILEAVAVLTQGQSHRGAEARHWLQDGREEAALTARLEGEDGLDLELRQKRGRPRQFRVNHRAVPRQREWAGKAPLVAFAPEELDLIRGEPGVRRRALNAVLSQLDPEYGDVLGRYNRVLEERNAALRHVRDGGVRAASLEPWDLALLKDGAWVSLARRRFLMQFGPRIQARQLELSGGRDRGILLYRPSFHLPAEEPEAVQAANRGRLTELREGEIALGASLIGPHRDDIEFRLDDELARVRASQGQARTLALAWKWEERRYLREVLGREPITVLDDVFAELDPSRRAQLTGLLFSGGQCFIALTDFALWSEFASGAGGAAARVFQVSAGAAVTERFSAESVP